MTPRIAFVALATAIIVSSACAPDFKPNPGMPSSPTAPTSPLSNSLVISGNVLNMTGGVVDGATVTARAAGNVVSGFSDSAGRFTLPPLDTAIGAATTIRVEKPGYRPVETTDSSGRTSQFNLKVFELSALAPDDVVTMKLSPDDPMDYVGQPYESDAAFNMKCFGITTPPDADVIVDLTWESNDAASLKMWAMDGAITSQSSGGKQTIRLPANKSIILVIGQSCVAGRLTTPLAFRIESHRAGD